MNETGLAHKITDSPAHSGPSAERSHEMRIVPRKLFGDVAAGYAQMPFGADRLATLV